MIFSPSVCLVFFFQAEDGIRDLVRSRGLGDVYKRQVHLAYPGHPGATWAGDTSGHPASEGGGLTPGVDPVSYTHLTLPTSDLV